MTPGDAVPGATRDQARVAELTARLEDAAAELTAWRGRYEAAADDLERLQEEYRAVTQELVLIRASRAYQAAERVRKLLRR